VLSLHFAYQPKTVRKFCKLEFRKTSVDYWLVKFEYEINIFLFNCQYHNSQHTIKRCSSIFVRTTKNGRTDGTDCNIRNWKETNSNFVARIKNALHRNTFGIRQSHNNAEFNIKMQMYTIFSYLPLLNYFVLRKYYFINTDVLDRQTCLQTTGRPNWPVYSGDIFLFYVLRTLHVTTMKQVAISEWN